MKCEICGKDIGDIIVVLPLKRANGALNTLACLKCAENSPAYCKKHKRPHLGFVDGTTACAGCIEEMVEMNQNREDEIFYLLRRALPAREYVRLLEWATISSSITGNSQKTCILRAIATKAKRSKQSFEMILNKIVITKSIEIIFPIQIFP